MGSKISINSLTKDPKMLETYPQDKLFTHHLSLNMASSLIDITLLLKKKNLV